MADVSEIYLRSVRRVLKCYYATWMPGMAMKLGDVGFLKGNQFIYVTSLDNLGVDFKIREDDSPSPLNIQSQTGVKLIFKPSGKISTDLPSIPEAEAGIGIEFGEEGAFVFRTNECYEPAIDDILSLGRKIKKLLLSGKWNKDYVVIVRLIKTPFASIYISKEANSKIEISVKSDLSFETIDLGDAKLEFSVKSMKGSIIDIPGAKNITPFFQIASLKQSFLSSAAFRPLAREVVLGKNLGNYMNDYDPGEIAKLSMDEINERLYFDIVSPEIKDL